MQQAQLTIKQYHYPKKIKIQHNNNNKQANTIFFYTITNQSDLEI